MLHGGDASARATCLTAILLANSEDTRRLIETQIGGEAALCFGLKRCTRTQSGRRHALFMPAALERPWRDLAARYAQEAGIEVIPTVANLAAGLLEQMRVFGDTWAAIVPATGILLDGQSIDACLTLLGQLPADYSYGADFPRGAAPLVVSQPIIAMGAARCAHGDPCLSVLQTIVECLPHFHGVPLPAPPNVRAPDLELALDSAQQAAELERSARTLAPAHGWASEHPAARSAASGSLRHALSCGSGLREQQRCRLARRCSRAHARPAISHPRDRGTGQRHSGRQPDCPRRSRGGAVTLHSFLLRAARHPPGTYPGRPRGSRRVMVRAGSAGGGSARALRLPGARAAHRRGEPPGRPEKGARSGDQRRR